MRHNKQRKRKKNVLRRRSDLVGVLELEAGDDLSLQLAVGRGRVQDALAELGNVGFARLPQDRVEAEV